MEIINGIYQFQIPLQFEPKITNIYVLSYKEGHILVDCGLNTPEAFETLEKGLNKFDISFSDIKLIFLTHYHGDHVGLAGRIKEKVDIPALIHRIDGERLESFFSNIDDRDEYDRLFLSNGLPKDILETIQKVRPSIRKFILPFKSNIKISGDGSIPDLPPRFKVVWTPGHTPGHICLYDRKNKVMFSGDHVLKEITPHIGYLIQSGLNPLKDYISSLKKILEIDIKVILPGHGPIIYDPQQRIHEILIHHEERKRLIYEAILPTGSTAYSVSQIIFGDKLTHFEKWLALSETLSHLELLRTEGKVEYFLKDETISYIPL